jgi:hypothetical protein
MKTIQIFSAFAVVSLLAAVGCSAASDDSVQSDEDLKAGVYACSVDSDCVAISKGGCCPEGWKVAVNKSKVKTYDANHVCNEQIVCPMYVVDDTRVAECNTGTHKCQMIEPENIRCGGFTTNPHKCPKGYTCEANKIPDVPGDCVAN